MTKRVVSLVPGSGAIRKVRRGGGVVVVGGVIGKHLCCREGSSCFEFPESTQNMGQKGSGLTPEIASS
jgi:hypothetical protein